MKRFLKKRPHQEDLPDNSVDDSLPSSSKQPCLSSENITASERMKIYKRKLKFNMKWKEKWKWMEYDQLVDGMFCGVCKKYGKPPASY